MKYTVATLANRIDRLIKDLANNESRLAAALNNLDKRVKKMETRKVSYNKRRRKSFNPWVITYKMLFSRKTVRAVKIILIAGVIFAGGALLFSGILQ